MTASEISNDDKKNDVPRKLILDQKVNMRLISAPIIILPLSIFSFWYILHFLSDPIEIYHEDPIGAIVLIGLPPLAILSLIPAIYRRTLIMDSTSIVYNQWFRQPLYVSLTDIELIRVYYKPLVNPFSKKIDLNSLIVEIYSGVIVGSTPKVMLIKGSTLGFEVWKFRCFMKEFILFISESWPDIRMIYSKGIMKDVMQAKYCDRIQIVHDE